MFHLIYMQSWVSRLQLAQKHKKGTPLGTRPWGSGLRQFQIYLNLSPIPNAKGKVRHRRRRSLRSSNSVRFPGLSCNCYIKNEFCWKQHVYGLGWVGLETQMISFLEFNLFYHNWCRIVSMFLDQSNTSILNAS